MESQQYVRVKTINDDYLYLPKATEKSVGAVKPDKETISINTAGEIRVSDDVMDKIEEIYNDHTDFKQDMQEYINTEATRLEKYIETSVDEEFLDLNNKINDLEAIKYAEQVRENTNNIKALYTLNIKKGVLAYDDAENTEEVRRTGGEELAGLEILDYSTSTVNRITGKSAMCKNLLDITQGVNNDFIKNADGSYTLNATGINNRFSNRIPINVVGNGTISCEILSIKGNGVDITADIPYALSFQKWDGSETPIGTHDFSKKSGNVSLTLDLTGVAKIAFFIKPGAFNTYSTYEITFKNTMLNLGETALPYQPYFTGFKNAQLSGIKSVGKNLLNQDELVGNSLVKNADGTYTLSRTSSGRFSKDAPFRMPVDKYYIASMEIVSIYDTNDGVYLDSTNYGISVRHIYKDGTSNNVGLPVKVGFVKASPRIITKEVEKFELYFYPDTPNGIIVTFKNLMVNMGDINVDAIPYEPYTESTIELPALAELGEWDYIEDGKLHKQTSDIYDFNGSENWKLSSDGKELGLDVKNLLNQRISGLKTTSRLNFLATGGSTLNGYEAFRIHVQDLPYTPIEGDEEEEVEEWKTYLSNHPFSAIFKKSEQTVTDFAFINKYTVYNNGTEQVLTQPDDDGNTCYDYGANATIENDYYVIGGTE